MRVLFSPVPGFSLPATQTKNVVPGGTAEGDASADFEGLLRSFMAGVQTDHGGQDILPGLFPGISVSDGESAKALVSSLFADEGVFFPASLRGMFCDALLRIRNTPETDSGEQIAFQSEPESGLSRKFPSVWSNPWQWIFPFSFQDIVSKAPLTKEGGVAAEELSAEDEEGRRPGTEEVTSGDPVFAYLASLEPGTPIVLDISFSFEEQSVFLDGSRMAFSGGLRIPSGQGGDAVVDTNGETGNGPEEPQPSAGSSPERTGPGSEQIRGMSFYRSFSASRMLRILPDRKSPDAGTDGIPEDPDVGRTTSAGETSGRFAPLREQGVVLSGAAFATEGISKDTPSGQTRISDTVNPADLREAVFETFGLNARSKGGNDASLAGERRGQGQKGDFSERSDVLQRLASHIDSAIRNEQNGGNLSFRSVMRDVLSAGVPLMAQDSGVFGEGVTDVVRFLNVEGQSRASIVVEPPALGRVDIELSQTASGIEASLKVNSEQLRQYIQDQTALIRNMLQQQGVALAEFSVDVRDMTQRDGSGQRDGQKRRERITGVDDPDAAEDGPAFRIDLEQGLLFWVA